MQRFLRPVRSFAFVVLSLAAAPATSLACSCWGTTDIGTALTRAEIVVVGRVERRLKLEYPTDFERSESADRSESMVAIQHDDPVAVKVIKVLKGDAAGEIRVTTDFMCYRSFNMDDFKPGDTFVFPIEEKTSTGLHVLPSCSHSALKLVDGELFTNELVRGGGRRLEPYMSLTAARLLLPLGLLHQWGRYLLAGAFLMLLPMLITRRIRKGSARTHPIESLRSVNLRSGLAIAWMLACGGLCIYLSLLQVGPLTLAIGVALAFAAALAATGLAFRWRWTEGFSYGLALLWIGAWGLGTYVTLSQYFEVFETLAKELIIALSIIGLTIVGMIWYADSVRRRFSPSQAPARAIL